MPTKTYTHKVTTTTGAMLNRFEDEKSAQTRCAQANAQANAQATEMGLEVRYEVRPTEATEASE